MSALKAITLIHLAITVNADFLMTGDKVLLALSSVPPVRIMGVEAWRATIA